MEKELLGDQGKSLSILITNSKFIVPRYQRGYKWNKNNWRKFYESVLKLIKYNRNFDDIHYIGNMIIKKVETFDNYANYEIVDGHQRIATFFIFFASMIKVMDDYVREGKIENREIKKYEDQKEDIIKLIFVDPDLDEEDYSKNILRFEPHKRLERIDFRKLFSNKNYERSAFTNVLGAYEFFIKQIKKESLMLSLVEVKAIFETLSQKFRFTVINLPKQTTSEEVLGIFEIINDTGQHLEPADKLKSLLFEKSIERKKNKEEEEKVQKEVDNSWEEMEKTLDNNPISINSFLYNFFASIFERSGKLKKKEFYEFAKEQFESEEEKKPVDMTEILSKIGNYSSFYKVIIDPPSFTPKSSSEKELKSLLIDIKRLGYYQLHQLILALRFDNHLKSNQKSKILDLIVKCMFRRITVKDLKASKEFEKRIQSWVAFVQKGEGEKILEDEYLKNEFTLREEKDEFYNKLKTRTLKKDKNRYIFGKYYLKLNPNVFQYNGKEEMEHLAPQSVVKKKNHPWKTIKGWKEKKLKELTKLINSIGNLTIIEDASNRATKDSLWSKKIRNPDYVNNICLRFEKIGKRFIDEKMKNGEELHPLDIENRSSELVEEIEKLGIFEFDF